MDNAKSQPDPRKIAAIQHFPTPKTTMNVRTFLGLIRYYKIFITRYVKIAEPLFALTKKDVSFFGCPYVRQLLLH